MKRFKTREKAFASQNYDPDKVIIAGVPDHLVNTIKAIINICVVTDAVNPGYNANFRSYRNPKFENQYINDQGVYRFEPGPNLNMSSIGPCFNSESKSAAGLVLKFCKKDYDTLTAYKRPRIVKE